MKKFITQIVFFLLPIIALSYFIDVFISTNLKKSGYFATGEFLTWNTILDGKSNAEIAIYGGSRSWVHINSTMMEDSLKHPTYNFGMNGYTFGMQRLRHELLLRNNPAPKLIIHSVDVSTLIKLKELYNPDQYLPYMLWNKDFIKSTIDYAGYNFYDYRIPLIRYYNKTEAIKASLRMLLAPKSNVMFRVKGYDGRDFLWNGDFDRVKKQMKCLDAHIDTTTMIAFDKYLYDCKKRNILVLLVWTPEYIEGQKFVKNRDAIVNIYKDFSKKYNIPFFDFSADTISYQKKYFYNAEHMNKTGAELFTKKLIEEIKKNDQIKAIL